VYVVYYALQNNFALMNNNSSKTNQKGKEDTFVGDINRESSVGNRRVSNFNDTSMGDSSETSLEIYELA